MERFAGEQNLDKKTLDKKIRRRAHTPALFE
jgi:hypothetical protein